MLYLFGPKETDFINGDSDLIHNTYDEVVDRSKGFYLKFKIALDKDERYKKIKKEMIISAHTPDGWNQFRVFDIYNHTNHVEVVATQLHYDLNYKKVFPFVVNKTTAQTALNVFVSKFKSDLPNFKFTSNIKDVHSFSTDDDLERLDEGHNALEILNRIASRWGGELQVDGYNVHLVSKLGKFTNALLYEHKNISEFVDETSMSEIITRIHAVSRFRPERAEGDKEEPEEVTIKVVVDSPLIDEYAQVYEEDYTNNDARTKDQLIAWARLKYTTNNVDKPTRSIQVETNIIDGQEINYGDDLVLKYTKHDVDEIIRCVGYQYNPNSRQYISVTLGSNINSMASTITGAVHDSTKNQLSNIEKQVQIIKYAANNVNRVTTGPLPIPDPIEGDMWYYHPEGRPNEVELRIFQDGGWVTIVSDMTGENVRKAIAELETEAEGLAVDIVASDQKAAAALEEAGISNNLAQTSKDLATTAKTNADTAKSNAADALAEASEAKTQAGQAFVDAKTAISNAVTAQTDAQTAMDNAKTALSTAGSADTKAGQAIAKANAIPTTITDIITDKNLVNGNYVDTKVDAATGAWSQELVRVEGKIPTYIGGRNYFSYAYHANRDNYTFSRSYSHSKDPIQLEPNTEYTMSYEDFVRFDSGQYVLFMIDSLGNRVIPVFNVIGKDGGTPPIRGVGKVYTFTTNDDGLYRFSYYARNNDNYSTPEGEWFTDIFLGFQIEKGNVATDWTPAPEDLYTQEDFKLFNAQYTQDVTGMTGRLTTVENNKLDGTTFQTFKQSEYQVTADKVASTVERVDTAEGKIATQGTAISQNATDIASKANTTTVNALTGRVDTAESSISQNATAISQRVTTTTYNTGLGTKENSVLKQSSAPAHLNGRLWLDTSVTPNILKRSTGTTWVKATPTTASEVGAYSSGQGSALAGRVTTAETNITQTSTAITSKADKSVVDTLSGTVSTHTTKISQNATAISSKAAQTEVDTVKGTVSTHTSTLSQHAKDISARLTQSQVDSLVNDKGYSTVSYVDTQMTATASAIRTEMTAIEGKIPTEIGGRNYAKGTSKEFTCVSVERYSGNLLAAGATSQSTYTIEELGAQAGDTMTVSMYVGESAEGYGGGFRIDDQGGQNKYSTYKIVKNGYVSETFTILEGTTQISIYTASYGQSGASGIFELPVRELKLEKGNIRTDWTPATEDVFMQNEFNSFKAEYDQSAKGWSTKLTQIEQAGYATKTWSNQTFATPQSITTALSSYAKKTDLNGLATESYVGTQIKASADGIKTELTKVEGKIPDSVQEENLVIKGDGYHLNSEYLIAEYDLTKDLIINNTYTAVLKGGIGSDGVTQKFTLFTDKGQNLVGGMQYVSGSGGLYRLTFKLVQNGGIAGDKKHIRIYNRPNNGSNARIEWFKLIEGDVTDNNFTPSRVDLITQHDYTAFKTNFDVKAKGWSATTTYVSNNQAKINSLISNADGWENTISYVDSNKTKINQTISRVDSYVQTIGTNGEKIARLVMTDSIYQSSIRKGGRNLLKDSYGYIGNPNRFHSSFDIKDPIPHGTKVTLSFKASSGGGQIVQIYNTNSYHNYGDVVFTKGTTPHVYHLTFTTYTHSNGGSAIDINKQQIRFYNGLKPNPTAYILLDWAVLQYGEIGTEHYISDDEDFETQVTQLENSWALTLKSGNDIKTQINATTNGIRLASKLIHLSGTSLIDNATIKSAMIDTLDAAKITTGTLNARNVKVINLDANSISGNEASFIQAMFTARHSALQVTGNGITVSKSNGTRSFAVGTDGVHFYSDTGPGAYITTHNIVSWNGSSWVDTGKNSVMIGSELNHSIGIGYKIWENGRYVTKGAIDLERTGSGVPELKINLPIKNVDYQRGMVSGENGTYFRNTQDSAGIWMGDNGKLCLITYGKLYNSTSWLNR